MRRWLFPGFLLAIGASMFLLLWLAFIRIVPPASQVHAMQSTPTPPQKAEAAQPSEPDRFVSPDTSANTQELAEVVPVSVRDKGSLRRTPLESAVGPEIGPGLTPGTVMENMRSVIRDYSARFGGNPFGNNREIAAKLNGGNQNQVVFLKPEDGMRLNERGELIDNWGTPFFFHQISGTEMEIHSAGPDRRMWTADDLIIK